MANEYNIISDEALDALCGAIKGIANAGEIVDDTGVAMDKTYSSFKIQEELDKKIEGDNVVKKDDIVTVLDDTITDNQVPSGKAVVDELSLKANDSEVVKKTDIVTTIDKTSTNNKVPSAKAVYSVLASSLKSVKIMYFEFLDQFNNTTLGVNSTNTITEVVRAFGNYIINTYGKSQYAILEFSASSSNTVFSQSLFNKIACIGTVRYMPYKHTSRVQVIITNVNNGNSYIGTLNNSDTNDIVWKKLCTTTVADVSETKYSLDTNCDGVYELGDKGTNNCWYAIKNGWCVVQFDLRCLQTMAGYKRVFASLPKPIATIANVFMSNDIVINEGDKPLIVIVEGDGMMKAEGGKLYGRYIGTFSYPVAE